VTSAFGGSSNLLTLEYNLPNLELRVRATRFRPVVTGAHDWYTLTQKAVGFSNKINGQFGWGSSPLLGTSFSRLPTGSISNVM
jgi:hypothetical protein